MFYEGLRLWEARFVMFYEGLRLWEAHLYVFYVELSGAVILGWSAKEEPSRAWASEWEGGGGASGEARGANGTRELGGTNGTGK